MVNVYGKNLSKREFLRFFGDTTQYASATPVILDSGKSTNVRAVYVNTGSGLEYIVLPGRALDIANASYKGMSLAWISKTGIVNPKYYESEGINWLRNFFGGLLTTCGLSNMGPPCVEDGKPFGLHGRITNTEAYDISINNDWIENELNLSISGKVKESVVFGENLIMRRIICSLAGSSKITIKTSVENIGFEPQPLMILLHVNFGFPIVSPHSEFYGPVKKVIPRDNVASQDNGIELYSIFHDPTPLYKEKVFFLELNAEENGDCEILIYNKKLNVGVYEKFNIKELPFFTMWKQMGENDYVVGLEPGNAYPLGRNKTRERKELTLMQPGELKNFNLEIGILDGKEEIENEKRKIDDINNRNK